jgi:hypothetical protein
VNEITKQNFIWGWLRMILGALQLTLAPLAIFVLLARGLYATSTWILILLATLATGLSRILYGGQSDPRICGVKSPKK